MLFVFKIKIIITPRIIPTTMPATMQSIWLVPKLINAPIKAPSSAPQKGANFFIHIIISYNSKIHKRHCPNIASRGVLSYLALSGPFAVWVTVWVREFFMKEKQPKKLQKSAETIEFRRIFGPSDGI